jgi:hypothetical protein
MPKIYDEQVDFTTTSVSSNQKDAASIQPVQAGENLWENVLNRTPENLRTRTEALRAAVEDLKYFADYDRALLLSAPNTTFTCTYQTDGYVLGMTPGPLWVYPALTPGVQSGGRVRGARMFVQSGPAWVPYAGTLGANDLTFIATGQFTGQRGYAEADDMTGGEFTVGGNRLRISLVANPAAAGGNISATVTGAPETLITVTYGTLTTPTTISQLIACIAADTSSQGSYGLAHILRGVTTSAGTAPPPAITNAVFQGGYDAEAHLITNLAPFFSAFDGANYINRLQEGESLAMAFVSGPVEPGVGSTGGRRQALFDLPTDRIGGSTDNTLSNLILFNTGREPEKIPGSIPIGKVIDGKFVFIDGTTVGTAPISLGESGVTLARLAAPTGAAMIGYDGSGNWRTGAGIPAGTVESAIDQVVADLAANTVTDGAARIGMDAITGTASAGNTALSLSAGSSRTAISTMLNTLTAPGGLNARVSELGHRMHGPRPIEKVFSEPGFSTDTGGGQLIRAELNKATNARTTGQIEEQPAVFIRPFGWTAVDSSLIIPPFFAVGQGTANDRLKLTLATTPQAEFIRDQLALTNHPTLPGAPPARLHCLARLNDSGSPLEGFYFAEGIYAYTGPPEVVLRDLKGATPNVSTVAAGATLEFFHTSIYGNDREGNQALTTVPGAFSGAAHAYFGAGKIKQGYDTSLTLRHVETVENAVWKYGYTSAPINSGTVAATAPGGDVLLNQLRVTGLTNMEPASVKRWLNITAASDSALVGQWLITNYLSATSVDIFVPDALLSLTSVTGVNWEELRNFARDTENILIKDDADLLRGVELTPVDATANHHHGINYANVTMPALSALVAGNIQFDVAGVHVVSFNALPDYLNSASALSFLPSPTNTLKGLFLEIVVHLEVDPTLGAGNRWDVVLYSSPGTSYDALNSRTVFRKSGYKVNALASADVYEFVETVLVPVNNLGQAAFSVSVLDGIIDMNDSTLAVRPSGVVSIIP